MAKIETSIELYDRVSAPINKMLGALGNLTDAFMSVETSMDGSFDTSKIEESRRKIEQAAFEVVQLGNDIEDVGHKARNTSSDVDGLTKKVKELVSVYALWQGVQKLVTLSDEYIQTNARLNMINDGLQTTDELQDKIFASAQRSRASYTAMADAVAKLSLNAKDAFSSNDETIQFAENLNKLFAIAGTEQAAMSSATLQLTQALGSGVLRGEEFNAVFEAAPNIMQTVADYMDVPIGKLRGMAQEGQITADVVKRALLGATNDINKQFESMPMTWAQVWVDITNKLYMASLPLLNVINWIANNLSILSPILWGLAAILAIVNAHLIKQAALWVWNSVLIPAYNAIVGLLSLGYGVLSGNTAAVSAAQLMYNNALLACPLTWILLIIIAVIAAIYAVVAAINKVTGSTLSATGIILGALTTAVAFIWNLFLSLVDFVLMCVNALVNPWIQFANFFGNLFNDPIASIIHLFGGLADNVLGILESIAKAIDKVFGSNLASAVQGWRSSLGGKIEEAANKHGNGSYEKVADNLNLSSESLGLKRWAYGDAYNTGYSWGEGIDDSVSNMFSDSSIDELNVSDLLNGDYGGYDASRIPSNIADTAGNTGSMADSMDITSEDLKYLRDIAETEAVNRFTTAEIKVEMTNHNNVSSDMDLDGMVDYLANGVNEAMEKAAEGVHE